jgi:hypothetical protein
VCLGLNLKLLSLRLFLPLQLFAPGLLTLYGCCTADYPLGVTCDVTPCNFMVLGEI